MAPYTVARLFALAPLRRNVERALAEIVRRSPNRCGADTLYAAIEGRLSESPDRCAAWVVFAPGGVLVGFCSVDLWGDLAGTTRAIISSGWIAPGHQGRPFDVVLPEVEAWARAHGARTLATMTRRSAAAYARWAGRRGFEQAETIFEKPLCEG